MAEHVFEIDGHEYLVKTHRGREGQRYALYFASLLPEVLVPLLQKALKGGAVDLNLDLAKLDLTSIGAALSGKLEELMDREVLVMGIFKYTTRDGQKLASETQYELAYDSNWDEWWKALIAIVRLNGWIPLPSTSDANSGSEKKAAVVPASESILAR